MLYREPYDDLDLRLARLDAYLRLLSYLDDQEPADKPIFAPGQSFLIEALLNESHHARQLYEQCWFGAKVANDRRAS